MTNVASGEVVELPGTAFLERVLFPGDGSIIREDNGVSGASNSRSDAVVTASLQIIACRHGAK